QFRIPACSKRERSGQCSGTVLAQAVYPSDAEACIRLLKRRNAEAGNAGRERRRSDRAFRHRLTRPVRPSKNAMQHSQTLRIGQLCFGGTRASLGGWSVVDLAM